MRGIQIGRIAGIPIKLNWTFLVVLPLFAALVAADVSQITEVLNQVLTAKIDGSAVESGLTPWLIGIAVVFGLFSGVLLHELGHSLVAMRYGYEIDSITLWLLGGLANFAEFPEDWRHEFWISIAGPIVSVLLGVLSYLAFLVVSPDLAAIRLVLGYLAVLNVTLAVLNMLPGFPMDGGRVLRALLARSRGHAVATQQAARVGKAFAVLLALAGLLPGINPFLILLALFIYAAASGEARQSALKATFEGVTVSDVMTDRTNLKTVSPDTTIAALLERMLAERHVGYPVLDNEQLVGMITLDDAADVSEVEREAFLVDDVMTSDVETVHPDDGAMEAFERLQTTGVGRLPVVDDTGELVGLISRTDLLRAVTIITSTGAGQTNKDPSAMVRSLP
jgi:Zn-dependent protease/predicted transcriptional regulator